MLQLYINDEFFDQPREENMFLTLFKPSLDIVYEDEKDVYKRQKHTAAMPHMVRSP